MSNIVQLERRVHDNFRTIDLTCNQDERLSWKAKGIHTYLISRPPGWKLNYKDLLSRSSEGKTALKSGLQELQDYGYLKIIQERTGDGKFNSTHWIVTQSPETLPIEPSEPEAENPDADNPHADNPHAENPDTDSVLYNKNINSKNSNSKNSNSQNEQDPIREIFDFWVDQSNTISHRKLKKPFKEGINARLDDGFTMQELKEAIRRYNYSLGDRQSNMTYKWTLGEFMSREEGGKVELYLADPHPYRFDKKKRRRTYSEDGHADGAW